jgi:hypothetical protein
MTDCLFLRDFSHFVANCHPDDVDVDDPAVDAEWDFEADRREHVCVGEFHGLKPRLTTKAISGMPLLKRKTDIKWADNPHVGVPYRNRMVRAVKSVDVLRSKAGLPLLMPLFRVGNLNFYNGDGDVFSSLGFSEEAFFYGLTQLTVLTGERRVALHGLLLCEDGQLATEGPAVTWFFNQGDLVFFSDSRTGWSGTLSRSRCNKYVECARTSGLMRSLGLEYVLKIKADLDNLMRAKENVPAHIECDVGEPIVIDVATTAHYSNPIVVQYKSCMDKTSLDFGGLDPFSDEVFDHIDSVFYRGKQQQVWKHTLTFHHKLPHREVVFEGYDG